MSTKDYELVRPNHVQITSCLTKYRSHHTSSLLKLEPSASISSQLQNAPAILQSFMPQHKLDLQTFVAPCRLGKHHQCCRAMRSDNSAGACMLLPSTEFLYSAIPSLFRTQNKFHVIRCYCFFPSCKTKPSFSTELNEEEPQ